MRDRVMRMLLVEDNESDVSLVRAALASSAMRTGLHVASDGDEALAYLRGEESGCEQRRPHLVLLDLNLPGLSGAEVLTELKNDPLLRAMPVVVFTGSRAAEDIVGAYDKHANSYITKPVTFAGYGDVVRAIEEYWFSTAALPESGR